MNTTLRQSSSSWELEALGAGIDDPLDELSLAVVLVDHAGRIRWQNRTSLARVGNRNGVPVVDTVAPEYRHVFQTQLAQALLGDRVDEIEIVVVGLDGARRRSRVNTVAMRREGEVVGLLVVATPLKLGRPASGRALSAAPPARDARAPRRRALDPRNRGPPRVHAGNRAELRPTAAQGTRRALSARGGREGPQAGSDPKGPTWV